MMIKYLESRNIFSVDERTEDGTQQFRYNYKELEFKYLLKISNILFEFNARFWYYSVTIYILQWKIFEGKRLFNVMF